MMIDQRYWPVTSNPKTNTASSFEAKCPVCNVPRWSALERGGCGHEECPYSVKPKPTPAEQEKKWLADFKIQQDHIIKLDDQVRELRELAIWMTGCGYDFTQHEYFREKKSLLSCGPPSDRKEVEE